MPMQREKSKWKNRKDQNTDAAFRGGTTRSSDETPQWEGSEGVVSFSYVDGSTGREECIRMTRPYEIPMEIVRKAYLQVKSNAGSAGIDGESMEDFEKNLEDNLYKIWNRMTSGSYFPPPVKAVEIPKKSGGIRVLGIPTIGDRVAQTVAKIYLEPLLEPIFYRDSYGYRPGKSAIDAVRVTRTRCWSYDWVIVLDIKGLFDSIDHELLMKLVRKHTDIRWVILYVKRWLEAPMQMPNGDMKERTAGTPQGGVISPLLANLFMHYAFDAWMDANHPNNPFERYADDGTVHCVSLKQALYMRDSIAARLRKWKLSLNTEKTHIAYCKDDERKGEYRETSFDFLGYTFRPRRSKNKYGRLFINFTPAVSNSAKKEMRRKMHDWRMRLKPDVSIDDLSRMFNPSIRGWYNYFSKFYKSETYPVLRQMNHALVQWARKKYKKLRRHKNRAEQWMRGIAERQPELFIQWQTGILPGRMVGAG